MNIPKPSLNSLVARLALSFVLVIGQCAWAAGKCKEEGKKSYKACAEALIASNVADNYNITPCGEFSGQRLVSKCYGSGLLKAAANLKTFKATCSAALEKCALTLDEGGTRCGDGLCMEEWENDVKGYYAGVDSKIFTFEAQAAQAGVVAGSTAAGPGGSNDPKAGGNGKQEDGTNWPLIGTVAAMAGVGALALTQGGSKSGQQQQQQQNSTPQQTLTPLTNTNVTHTPTWTPDGECGADNTQKYSNCNDYFSKNCQTNSTDDKCKNFWARYCGTGQASLGSTTTDGLTVDKTGEGMGKTECSNILAVQFCADTSHSQCPSCVNLASQNNSPACTGKTNGVVTGTPNPALCMPQYNQCQLAGFKLTCPTDPMFSNPALTQISGQVGVGSTSCVGNVAVGGPPSTLPVPVVQSTLPGFKDVLKKEGPNLASVSSNTYQAWCAKYKVNCNGKN